MASNLPPRETVLVVDDTPETLRFLMDTIDRAGFTALVATTGESAVELLGHVTPGLILMDAVMPGMGGFETTRQIKRNPDWAHIPVIFMTGLTESEHVIEALEAGGIDYVRKPVVVEELLARVRVHLANARIARGSQLALDATGRHLIAVDPSAKLLWSTPQAQTLLAEIAPGWDREDAALPAILLPPVLRLLGDAERTPVRMDLGDTTLELVFVTQNGSEELLIRLNAMRQGEDIRRLQTRFSLTLREAEVLLWISFGKPNRDISEILGISPRTVNKHLEQIFEKLGVETRATAAALAVRAIVQ